MLCGDGKFDGLCLKKFEEFLTRGGAKIYAHQNAWELCFQWGIGENDARTTFWAGSGRVFRKFKIQSYHTCRRHRTERGADSEVLKCRDLANTNAPSSRDSHADVPRSVDKE